MPQVEIAVYVMRLIPFLRERDGSKGGMRRDKSEDREMKQTTIRGGEMGKK